MAPRLPVEERFWSKVKKTRTCWLWTAPLDPSGHGRFHFEQSSMMAHRVAWILTNGPLLPGLVVCHTCSTTACVRPSHMTIGTQSDNARDRNRRPRGTLKLLARPRLTQEERFWARVDKAGDCWMWTGGRSTKGYGHMNWDGKPTGTHRIAWEIAHGPIPDGLFVRHLICDNPPCVRVDHLALGTHDDNMQDMVSKQRHIVFRGSDNTRFGKHKTHCKKGHELSGDHLVVTKQGHYNCRICRNDWHRNRWHARSPEEKSRLWALQQLRHPRVKKGLVHGEQHALTTLTAAQVYEIRAKATQPDITFVALAKEYHTSPSTIRKIAHRQTWKYLPEEECPAS